MDYLIYKPMAWTKGIYAAMDDDVTQFGRETLAEVKAKHPDDDFEIVDETTLHLRLRAYEDTLKTQPKRITKERFYDMFEVLAPCRWRTRPGGEVFHVSERLTGNLVSWFLRSGNDYFECVQSADIDVHVLFSMLRAREQWLAQFSRDINTLFGISLDDCGLPDALYTPEKEPAVAAQEYGEKYRLTPLT